MNVCTLIDTSTTGHSGYGPVRSVGKVQDILYDNGKQVMNEGVSFAVHCVEDSCHSGVSVKRTNNPLLYVDGKAICHNGDGLSCGDNMGHSNSIILIKE